MIKRKKNVKAEGVEAKIKKSSSRLVLVAVLAVTVVSTVLNISSTMGTLEDTMTATAKVSSERLSAELTAQLNVVSEMGGIARLSNESLSEEEKQEIINQRVEAYGLVRGKLIHTDGICHYDGTDYSDREYFQAAMNGDSFISDPIESKTDGTLSIILASPIWKDGVKGSEVAGVVFLVDNASFLNDLVADTKISENAGCYMLNSEGVTIAHSTPSVAEKQENTIEESKQDSSLKSIANLETKMTQGENGYGVYFYGGSVKLMAYAPVSGTNGWSAAITAPIMDFIASTAVGVVICVLLMIVFVVLGNRISGRIGKQIGQPVRLCAERLELLAAGDLHSEVPQIKSDDETGVLADATERIVGSMNEVIQDVGYLLGEMSSGNFKVRCEKEDIYAGDFHGLVESMRTLNRMLSTTLSEIREASRQVSAGSGQLAESAQELAEGATDQAGAVEELQATITDVTQMMETNTKSIQSTAEQAVTYEEQAQTGGREMENLTEAMKRISEASKQINDIIQEIEDIASQTNLLSLNASIEAARAGESGKGFAVVADQIGKLANDSAQSAVHTRELIETSLTEIANGNAMTDRTAQTLQSVIEGMEFMASSLKEAVSNSTHQTEAMEQIEKGIEQISSVVESNSAAAEETSATSEELAAQAASMDEHVGKFEF